MFLQTLSLTCPEIIIPEKIRDNAPEQGEHYMKKSRYDEEQIVRILRENGSR
jgi:hypothetical protein